MRQQSVSDCQTFRICIGLLKKSGLRKVFSIARTGLGLTFILAGYGCAIATLAPSTAAGSPSSYPETAPVTSNREHAPRQIVLTWQDDTRSTMTITWRTDEPLARTVGMKRIEQRSARMGSGLDFEEVRDRLVTHGWQNAGYDSAEQAFLDLCVGVMNHTGRGSDFAYRFLLTNWYTYSHDVGLEKELLPDREVWSEVHDGISSNYVLYAEGHEWPDQTGQLHKAWAESYTFPETSAWLHRVTLRDLQPGTTYSAVIHKALPEDAPSASDAHSHHPVEATSGAVADSAILASEPFLFRTAPDDKRPVTFIMGADTQSETPERREMTALAASLDPEFVVLSGDLVMNGMAESEWEAWFDEWHELMITPEGRRVPVMPALGNHDVRGWVAGDFETDAAFYANRFNLPSPRRYYSVEFGPGLVLVSLDTGHTSAFHEQLDWFIGTGSYEAGHGPHRVRTSHDGLQQQWLNRTLETYSDRPWLLAHYHINAFGTSQRYWEKERYGRRLMHEHWIPLFEKYGVDLVHEGHGHRMKRTKPIREGRIDEQGVVYIGEGGWGTHMGTPEDLWFLADGGSEHHFWKITLNQDWHTLSGHPVLWREGHADRGQGFTLQRRDRSKRSNP